MPETKLRGEGTPSNAQDWGDAVAGDTIAARQRALVSVLLAAGAACLRALPPTDDGHWAATMRAVPRENLPPEWPQGPVSYRELCQAFLDQGEAIRDLLRAEIDGDVTRPG